MPLVWYVMGLRCTCNECVISSASDEKHNALKGAAVKSLWVQYKCVEGRNGKHHINQEVTLRSKEMWNRSQMRVVQS